MPKYTAKAVANGLRTDHPIPDLPFVDDSHIPLEDPAAIEAVGRHRGEGMWGREDTCRDGGWVAFTTDPIRHDLGWCVRWHPEHGRSVTLYRDRDAAGVHADLGGPALLFRAGGYWWDGTTWYRPSQVWDAASEDYYQRPVPAATTITAADLLDGTGDPERAEVLAIIDADPDAAPPRSWSDHLALWAVRRPAPADLDHCVVKIAAPELTGDQLLGTAQMATVAGVSASTLRAYISRGEGGVPLPQAAIGGRNLWSRAVAEEWAEQRRRSHEGVTASLAADYDGTSQHVGIADLWSRFTQTFLSSLWEHPEHRKRWALRWRTKGAAEALAKELAWDVAAGLDEIVPLSELGDTIRHAVLDEFHTEQQRDRTLHQFAVDKAAETGQTVDAPAPVFYGISISVAKMLDWLIRHDPTIGARVIGEIIGEAERRFGTPRRVSEQSLRTALSLDGQLDADTRADFLDRVFTPHAER
ncbi:helix-turn-helix transcriptional regulator [Spirillospora sp. NPDC050679]